MDDKRIKELRGMLKDNACWIKTRLDRQIITELVDEVERLKELQRWIPVSEKLPEPVNISAGAYQTVDIAYKYAGYDKPDYMYITEGYLCAERGWVKSEFSKYTNILAELGYEVLYWKYKTYPQPPEEK